MANAEDKILVLFGGCGQGLDYNDVAVLKVEELMDDSKFGAIENVM